MGFFGQSPRLEFLGMPRGIFIFSSFWSSFVHHFGLRLLHHFLAISEIRRIRSKNHKNDKKKWRFLVGFLGQSPRPEFLGMPRGIFIFSLFWSSFFRHFGLRLLHHFLGISEIRRIRSKNHKNDEKIKKNEDFWWGSLARALGRSFWECLEESSFFHHFGLRLLHHFLGISEIRRVRGKNHKNDEKMKKQTMNKW